jgi:hypothetical protein
MSFASVYPLYISKAAKKGGTKSEVDEIIRWLTGYTQDDNKGREIMDTIQKHSEEEVFNIGPSKIKMVYQRFGDSAFLSMLEEQVMETECTSRREGIRSEYKERTDTIQIIGPRAFLPWHKSCPEAGRLAGTWLWL